MTEESRLALVTGANRGLGLEIARQLATEGIRVILTAREQAIGCSISAEGIVKGDHC